MLQVTIFTGVTHQIRCQLALLGFPIVGDELYGADTVHDGHSRLLLHAAEATFRHPLTGLDFTVACPPPPEFTTGARG